MKKQIFLCLLLAICAASVFSQSVSSNFFEVFTRQAHTRTGSGFSFNKDSILARINNIPDTAGVYATFVISVNAVANVDSIEFVLVNSQQTTVYSSKQSISELQNSSSFKINNNTLYYTVGPFAYLKKFSATMAMRGTDGEWIPSKSFAKN